MLSNYQARVVPKGLIFSAARHSADGAESHNHSGDHHPPASHAEVPIPDARAAAHSGPG